MNETRRAHTSRRNLLAVALGVAGVAAITRVNPAGAADTTFFLNDADASANQVDAVTEVTTVDGGGMATTLFDSRNPSTASSAAAVVVAVNGSPDVLTASTTVHAVNGTASGRAVHGKSTDATGFGVVAENSGGGFALKAVGSSRLLGSTIVDTTNSIGSALQASSSQDFAAVTAFATQGSAVNAISSGFKFATVAASNTSGAAFSGAADTYLLTASPSEPPNNSNVGRGAFLRNVGGLSAGSVRHGLEVFVGESSPSSLVSDSNIAVYALNESARPDSVGVYGTAAASGGVGIWGVVDGSTKVGVKAENPGGTALLVDGTSSFTDDVSVAAAVSASSFSGGGAALTALNAANVTSGTLSEARLPASVALKNASYSAFAGPVSAKKFAGSGKGAPAFQGAGSATVRKGKTTLKVINPAISASAHIIATLESDPRGVSITHVSRASGSFTVNLSGPAPVGIDVAYIVFRA